MFDTWKNKYKRYKMFKRYSKKPINPEYFGTIALPLVRQVYPISASCQIVPILPWLESTQNDSLDDIKNNMDKLIKILEE